MYHKLDIVAAFVLWLWRHTTGLPGYAGLSAVNPYTFIRYFSAVSFHLPVLNFFLVLHPLIIRLCIGARKQAYLALCRLFCRKSQYTFPVHLLTKFYDTLDYVCALRDLTDFRDSISIRSPFHRAMRRLSSRRRIQRAVLWSCWPTPSSNRQSTFSRWACLVPIFSFRLTSSRFLKWYLHSHSVLTRSSRQRTRFLRARPSVPCCWWARWSVTRATSPSCLTSPHPSTC